MLDFVKSIGPSVVDLLRSLRAEEGVSYQLSMVVQPLPGPTTSVHNLMLTKMDPAQPTQAQLMACWNRVVEYRDEFELTCSESIHQMDGPQIAAASLADDLVQIVGFLKSEDDEGDE